MQTTTTATRRALRRGLLAAACLLLAACATPPQITWPAALAPADGERWLTTLAARGVQIDECRTGTTGPGWAFVAPEAALYDDARRTVGSHGAGPSWQAADGSRVDGTVTARAVAPLADAVP